MVYGRRRQGKSYLLRRLTGAVGGLYHLATEQAEPVSLRRFGDSLATWAGLSAGAFGFGGWEQALRTATEVMAASSRSHASRGVPPLLVLDEFPYLAQETPGLPSIVQSLYDGLGPGAEGAPRRFACSCAARRFRSWRICCPGPGRCAAGLRSNCASARSATGTRGSTGGSRIPPRPSRTTPSSAARPATGSLCPIRRFRRDPRSLAAGSRGTCCGRPCRCSTRPAGSCTRTRASATPPRTVRCSQPWRRESPRRRRSAACSAARLPH